MAITVKVLTVGSALGAISDLFVKIKAINAKHGKFDFVLCIGDFFGPDDDTVKLLAGDLEGGAIPFLHEVQLIPPCCEAPTECYIMQGEHPLPENVVEKFAKTGGELCKNVFLLSKSGIITTAYGLRIACLGGVYDSEIYSSAEAAPVGLIGDTTGCHHTIERLLSNTLTKSTTNQSYKSLATIQSSASSSQLVDVLITNVWPSLITRFSSAPLPAPELASIGVSHLDDVIRRIKPRYHFAARAGKPPKFWEREPFVWDNEQGRVSRFISLGAFGGEPIAGKKQRWFYAFSIVPNTAVGTSVPRSANATKNPFLETAPSSTKRPLENEGENYIFGNVRQPMKRSRLAQGEPGKPPPGYKCRRCESTEHFINDCPERENPPDGLAISSEIAPPNMRSEILVVENRNKDTLLSGKSTAISRRSSKWKAQASQGNRTKHLIVAIGSECYVTLPKGQIIPTPASHENIPGGGHVLIVPITHYPTFNTIPPDLAPPILEETVQYKSALRAMYVKYGNEAVFFEVGRLSAKGGHAHTQAVPVPLKLKDKVEVAFIQEGRLLGIDFEEDPDVALKSCEGGRGSYFRVDLPDGRKMVHLMKDHVPFSLQFGRQVLVNLMNMPERLDWKACMLTEEEDRADAQGFKAAFAPFDTTT
ncbi:nuclear protein [Tricholoma matsutake]|nr:nuclear protein [Tricholoma matsutake 945]KAF8234863.1 nuclear protein [Tricholoma matsutake 945]